MRHAALLATVAIALPACFGSSSSPPPDAGQAAPPGTDSGSPDASDAATPLDATASGADSGAPEASASPEASADAGLACLGNASVDFASLAPYWLDASTACGTATFASNAVAMTYAGPCTPSTEGGTLVLDPAHWQLCGDFDVAVTFDLATFPLPSSASRWAAFRAYDAAGGVNGISLERFDAAPALACVPATQNYKSWSTDGTNCSATYASTADTTGKLRLTRTGSTVTSYYFSPADGGSWVQVLSVPAMTTTPWSLTLYTGDDAGTADTDLQTVTFSSLTVTSATTP